MFVFKNSTAMILNNVNDDKFSQKTKYEVLERLNSKIFKT